MDILFTTNNKFWSKTFKYLTKEPVSHLAFLFNINDCLLTIDCSVDGGRLMTYDKFISSNHPVYKTTLKTDSETELHLFKKSLFLVGKKYDMPAYIYGIWRGILFTIFGLKAPKRNLLSKPDLYCCTEIFLPIEEILKQKYNLSFSGMDLAIKTPYELYIYVKAKTDEIYDNKM